MISPAMARPLCSADGEADLPNTLEELGPMLSEVRERVRRHRDTVDMRLECVIVRRMSEVAGSHAALEVVLQQERRTSGAGNNGTAIRRRRSQISGGGLSRVSKT